MTPKEARLIVVPRGSRAGRRGLLDEQRRREARIILEDEARNTRLLREAETP